MIFSIIAFRVSRSSSIAIHCSINTLLFLLVSLSASSKSRFLCINDVDPPIYPWIVPSARSTISSGCIWFPSKHDRDLIRFISFFMHSTNQTSLEVVESNKNLKISKKYYINLTEHLHKLHRSCPRFFRIKPNFAIDLPIKFYPIRLLASLLVPLCKKKAIWLLLVSCNRYRSTSLIWYLQNL